ncbi:hypothetical protein [Aeromonas media]|uniref:hypothetical protein n=1 Tax=Aeromonas media TaxID=651 RepID=UPI00214B7763|nr:hypothetical protein [Aeromonas media]
MKLAEIAVLSVLGLLAWTQWQEWQLNRNDAITLAYQGVPVVSLWQCGQLKQKMADLTDHTPPNCNFSTGDNLSTT